MNRARIILLDETSHHGLVLVKTVSKAVSSTLRLIISRLVNTPLLYLGGVPMFGMGEEVDEVRESPFGRDVAERRFAAFW